MNPISQYFFSIEDPSCPSRQAKEYIEFGQQDSLFQLALLKNIRLETLKKNFKKCSPTNLWLGPRLSVFEFNSPDLISNVLSSDFFLLSNSTPLELKINQLENSIVIISNNDIATQESREIYSDLITHCDTTCFVTWDWDNHHWLDLSIFLAAHSDIYAPSHHENLYLLSRYNWHTIGPIYCGTEQWSREFLTNQLEQLLSTNRSDAPLGMHIPHPTFSFRMQIVKTLNAFYPSIGFSAASFHNRSPEDRLKEWFSHKSHWIAPVLNDVPIRLFDALITGGIPIVPISMQFMPPVYKIPREYIVFYSVNDIVNPHNVVQRAKDLFDHCSKDGIVARHRYALDNHHGDTAIRSILTMTNEALSSNR
jgi:hypothetical protein